MTTILILQEGCYVDNCLTFDDENETTTNICKIVKVEEDTPIPLTSESYLKASTLTGYYSRIRTFLNNKKTKVILHHKDRTSFATLYELLSAPLEFGFGYSKDIEDGVLYLFGGALGSEKITTIVKVEESSISVYIVDKQNASFRMMEGAHFFATKPIIDGKSVSTLVPEYIFEINSRLPEAGTSSSYDFYNFEDGTITHHDSAPEAKKMVDLMFINTLKIGQGE